MPETAKEKKIRLYKFASEYNLSTESIIEFLQKKGYEVKGHMAILSEEMLGDIKLFFKKDIEKAEKHYKKISEFQKKRTDRTDSEQETETPVEVEVPQTEETQAIEHKEEETHQETEVPVEEEQQQTVQDVVEEKVVDESVAEEKVEAVPEVEDTPAEETKPFRTQSEIALDGKKKGLTIVGKIDLVRKPRHVEKPIAGGVQKPAVIPTTAEEED